MIRMAATGEFDGASMRDPKASEQDFRYVWAPSNSQMEHSDHYSYLQSDDEFDFETYEEAKKAKQFAAGLQDPEPPNAYTPFKFPEHDTVIKTARQLSNLASRQSSRAERHLHEMSEMGMPQRNAYSEPRNAQRSSRQHSRSASFTGNGPVPTGNFGNKSHRPRSRSANAPIGRKDMEQYPPPPVRVSVSKENIQASKPGSARARLRYTSHWD